jgi:hypothetical protein
MLVLREAAAAATAAAATAAAAAAAAAVTGVGGHVCDHTGAAQACPGASDRARAEARRAARRGRKEQKDTDAAILAEMMRLSGINGDRNVLTEAWCREHVGVVGAGGVGAWPADRLAGKPPMAQHVVGCHCGYCGDMGGSGDGAFEMARGGPSVDACDALVALADDRMRRKGGWGAPNTGRHMVLPTTDISFIEVAAGAGEYDTEMQRCAEDKAGDGTGEAPGKKVVAEFVEWFHSILIPTMCLIYGVGPGAEKPRAGDHRQLYLEECFVVRYSADEEGAQNELAIHRDNSPYSFNLVLSASSDYSGGGTYFEALDRTCHMEKGGVVMHRGCMRHAGNPVTRGTRYILVGFVGCRIPSTPCEG